MSKSAPSVSADDPELTVTLTRSQWVTLATSLGQRPYAEVAEMIEGIAGQLREQIGAAEAAPPESARAERSH